MRARKIVLIQRDIIAFDAHVDPAQTQMGNALLQAVPIADIERLQRLNGSKRQTSIPAVCSDRCIPPQLVTDNSMAIGIIGKQARRAVKRVTLAWRYSIADNSPPWLRRIAGTPAQYLDMLFIDHGIFRVVYSNLHRIDALAWRSSQPTPLQVKGIVGLGVKTIVNLRGERLCGSYALEQAACRKYGVRMVNYQVRSRAAPSLDELRGARALFEQVEYPILMHCKSGADRAGLMSVLYLHYRGVPMEEAVKQLSLRYGHIRQADTGVLDAFFERYMADTKERPMPFFEWVETVYDPDELKRTFRASGMANRLVNQVLRRE
jgi:protein tyrosine phosphatase (PTP) superfamily phosphohydrolase (DUF442 family)